MTHLLRIYQTVEPSCQAKCLVEDMNNDGLRRGKTNKVRGYKVPPRSGGTSRRKKNWKISLSRQRLGRKEEDGGRGETVARCSQHLPNNPPLVSFLAPMKSIISTLNHRVARQKDSSFFFLTSQRRTSHSFSLSPPFMLTLHLSPYPTFQITCIRT